MELVSASKLRKASEYALQSRDYYDLAIEILSILSVKPELAQQSFFEQRTLKNHLYVVVTSNSGLAGAYNSNVLKRLTDELIVDSAKNYHSHVIAVGNKGAQFVRRFKDLNLEAVCAEYKDQPSANDIRPLLLNVINLYKDHKVDRVTLIYTKFKSTISQQVRSTQLLPIIELEDLPVTETKISNFEPDLESVIDQIAIRLIEAELWQAILEALASEQAMRMMAMKNASDNAKDLIEDYTLELNTLRQASITQELAEISGGVEALKD